ncbi:hypothetical protein CXB51_009189 [Gossypium anomalum]|uniref:FAS1 domain-containing protein n=1 Tax=Gossypium anomalum TaxID=47600 RepID=A0A8J6D7B4_9ROSI|nr:hypothetical protein CXB51_009189 [Gossypium anomalum]
MTSETRPPLGINITKALVDDHNFNVASTMLSASGVVNEFEVDEDGARITLFVPTDGAFGDPPGNVRLQSLPTDKKLVVLKFHVLHSYYPLGSLESIVNPVQPTLVTEDNGTDSFTLNISRVKGSVAIDMGIVQASIVNRGFRERFSQGNGKAGNPMVGTTVQPPETSPSPENSPWLSGPASSPSGFHEDMKSNGERFRLQSCIVALCCIGLYPMV